MEDKPNKERLALFERLYKEWQERRAKVQSSPILKAGTFQVINGQKSSPKLYLLKGGKEK